MNKLAVDIKELSYSINQTDILKNINLQITKGQFIGIIGPNGAGKTTLLKCINGILKSAGKVTINNQVLSKLSVKEIAKETALMHQNTSISFPFTSLDVVLMGRYPHIKRFKSEGKEDNIIAKGHMKYTDTTKFENISVTQLSGGERQRVLFAKVLTQETDIVLLDEPTASLDITHQEQIFKYSQELCDSGKTVIAAVHDLKIASRYCSNLILMKAGEIISHGAPEEVLTGENLSLAYGVNALVYRSKITGLLDFHLHNQRSETTKTHVHIIGGGGSASAVIRLLFENGFYITVGVLTIGDSDMQCAEVFGIERLVGEPFSDISQETYNMNIDLVKKADTTILCNMPFGQQNLKNLEAAGYAKRLVIIEDDSPEARDFSGGKALDIYNNIKKKAIVTTSARFHEII
jgi:iron complex transport system ATP-binding protein